MRTVSGALVGALAAGSVLLASGLTAVPASAANAPCPVDNFCVYKDSNFGGRVYNDTVFGSYDNLRNFYYNGTFDTLNDSISSVVNNYRYPAYLYKDIGFKGEMLYIPPLSSMATLGSMNDKASAMSA